MDRIEVLNKIYAARTRLEAALERLSPEQMTEPDLPAGWSVKDLLAHLGRWEQHGVDIYQSLLIDADPHSTLNESEVDAFNAVTMKLFHARSLSEVRDFERAAFRSLVEMVETMPETDLFDPQRFAWTRGRPFVTWVGWNTYEHYDEHLPALESKLAEDRAALRPSTASTPASKPADAAAPGKLNPVVERAKEFLDQAGRDIDRALFDFRFGALPVEEVLAVLSRYQNPDGGFTRLEFDIQSPLSNPFATEQALVMLTWLDPPRDHPLVQRLVSYLEAAQDEDGNWRFAPEVYQHGLAPWFQGWQWPNLSPSTSLAALLKQLGLGSDLLHTRVQTLFARLASPADLAGSEFYLARAYAYYLQSEWAFPQAEFYRWGLVWWLARQHLTNPDLDATHFCELVPQPDSAIARRMPQALLAAKLDQLLAEQSADGGWPTPYDPRWRTWITIHNLLILRAHGRV